MICLVRICNSKCNRQTTYRCSTQAQPLIGFWRSSSKNCNNDHDFNIFKSKPINVFLTFTKPLIFLLIQCVKQDGFSWNVQDMFTMKEWLVTFWIGSIKKCNGGNGFNIFRTTVINVFFSNLPTSCVVAHNSVNFSIYIVLFTFRKVWHVDSHMPVKVGPMRWVGQLYNCCINVMPFSRLWWTFSLFWTFLHHFYTKCCKDFYK